MERHYMLERPYLHPMPCHSSGHMTRLPAAFFLTGLLLLAALHPAHAQSRPLDTIVVPTDSNKEAYTLHADERVKELNGLTDFRIVRLESVSLMEVAAQGSNYLYGYYKGDTIFKLSVTLGLSYGKRQLDYYLLNGRPFYILETEKSFPKPGFSDSLDPLKPAINFEGRYYLQGTKLVAVKTRGRKRIEEEDDEDPDTLSSQQDIRALLSEGDSYLRAVKSRMKKPRKKKTS